MINIIVDSSVWFEYFKGNEPYKKDLQMYLNTLSIKIIDPIIGEIILGALNQNEIDFIRSNIRYVPKIEIKDLFEKSGEYSFENKLFTKGIGLIDATLIYATIETNSLLWTLDKKIINYLDNKYLYLK